MANDIPIACTLSTSDYRSRIADIASLSRDALRGVERRGLTLDLRYAPEAAARVRRLVEQELHEDADQVRLLVTAPAAAAEVVPELLAELTGRHP